MTVEEMGNRFESLSFFYELGSLGQKHQKHTSYPHQQSLPVGNLQWVGDVGAKFEPIIRVYKTNSEEAYYARRTRTDLPALLLRSNNAPALTWFDCAAAAYVPSLDSLERMVFTTCC